MAAVGWEEAGVALPEVLHRPAGCSDCRQTGYHGRFGVHEVMAVTPEIRELILGRVSAEVIRTAAQAGGMRPMRVDGLLKAVDGRTSLEELIRAGA